MISRNLKWTRYIENIDDDSQKSVLTEIVSRLEAALSKEADAFSNIQAIMDFIESVKLSPPQEDLQEEEQEEPDNQRVSYPEYHEYAKPYANIPPWKRYSWFRRKN